MVDVSHSMMTGGVIYISQLCNFGWYEFIKYRKIFKEAYYPYSTEILSRCLGMDKKKVN